MNYASMSDSELNHLCAVKVMGYFHDEGGCWYSPSGTMGPASDLPDYCDDTVTVFGPGGVVEKMIERGYSFGLVWTNDGIYEARFTLNGRDFWCGDGSITRAVVLAATKAVGGKDND